MKMQHVTFNAAGSYFVTQRTTTSPRQASTVYPLCLKFVGKSRWRPNLRCSLHLVGICRTNIVLLHVQALLTYWS